MTAASTAIPPLLLADRPGGSNGTKGAQADGRLGTGRYSSQPAFGTAIVGLNPPASGGGSGGGGGCGMDLYEPPHSTYFANTGGGGGGGGSAGGTYIFETPATLTVSGTVNVNGGDGGNGGSGGPGNPVINIAGGGGGGGAGGAGGYIVLQGGRVVVNGSLQATGGRGGLGGAGLFPAYPGAGGGGGRITIYSSMAFEGTPTDGANAGGQDGGSPSLAIVTATLTDTPVSFLPRTAPLEDPAACATGGCYQQYTVTLSPQTAAGTVTFQLRSSALRGYATNACFSNTRGCTAAEDSAPDFSFENYRQSSGFAPASTPTPVIGTTLGVGGTIYYQTLQTSAAVHSATATVTSFDYGGVARLAAEVDIGGIKISALVPLRGELFARIPIDTCSGGPVTGCRGYADTHDDYYYSNGQ